MNQTFSFSRFAQLNRWFWAANGRTYSLGLLALLIITTLVLGRVLLVDGYEIGIARSNVPYFIILLLVTVSVLSTQLVSVLHDQHSALLYLMLPASRTEKFAVAVFYFLLFMVGYSLFYGVIEALFFQLANSRLPATANHYRSELLEAGANKFTTMYATGFVFLSIAVTGLLSSLYFRRGVLVKNMVLILLLAIGLSSLYSYIVGAFFPGLETHTSQLFSDAYVHPKGQYANAPRLPVPAFIKYVFPWLLLGALWVIARIRFNEIER